MPDKKQTIELLSEAVKNDDVPKIYANSFGLGMSNADIHVVLQQMNKPVAVINMSYTLAKTLHERLGGLMANFEAKAEQQILTTDKIDKIFSGETH